MSKIKSYLGFCRKAGDLVIGYNNLEKTKNGVYLVIKDLSLGESTQKKVTKICNKLGCKQLLCNNLAEFVGGDIKVVAIKNKSLADAIILSIDENFTWEVTNG